MTAFQINLRAEAMSYVSGYSLTWQEVIPSLVPAILKSMLPVASSIPCANNSSCIVGGAEGVVSLISHSVSGTCQNHCPVSDHTLLQQLVC